MDEDVLQCGTELGHAVLARERSKAHSLRIRRWFTRGVAILLLAVVPLAHLTAQVRSVADLNTRRIATP